MSPNPHRRVLAIALDSAEPRLVEKWINDGTLPNLKKLRSMGAYGRLKSSADWLPGSPWPTFYTGTDPGEHGLYEMKQWQAELMQEVQVNPRLLPLVPFWRTLGEFGLRVISVDPPMTYPPEPFDGIEICGWLTYDAIGNVGKPTSYPATEIDDLRDKFGLEPVPIPNDKWMVQSVKSLLEMRNELIQATENLSQLAKTLMENEKWDLFIVSFATPHRGGHKLCDFSGTFGKTSTKDKMEFTQAMRDIYVACDRAVGNLVEAATQDTDIVIFSLHGMQANTNRSRFLPQILDCILDARMKHDQHPRETRTSIRGTVSKAIPSEWLSTVFPPNSVIRRLALSLLSKFFKPVPRNVNAPALSLQTSLNGYIRINLKGREKNGTISPGEECDRLCSTIIEDLKTFTDVETKQSIIEDVKRSDELFKSAKRLQYLPDLIIRWTSTPTVSQRKIVSSRYPYFFISVPTQNLDGRSGNHTPEGFLLAVGSGIAPNSKIEKADILDLAPTILELLNVQKSKQMSGHSLF